MVLGVPAVDGEVVVLVQQQPLLLVATLLVGAHQHELAAQLLAVELDVQLSGLDGRARIVGLLLGVGHPGAAVPHDDVTAAVPTARDDPLEGGVLDRVVLHVHRQPAHRRVERGSLGHRPRDQHAVHLEPEVVVQRSRAVALDDERQAVGSWGRVRHTLGLARRPEVAHPAVRREAIGVVHDAAVSAAGSGDLRRPRRASRPGRCSLDSGATPAQRSRQQAYAEPVASTASSTVARTQ